MTGNLFLTGPIQIGKSTALRQALEACQITPGGFLTRWSDRGDTLHMLPVSGGTCCPDNQIARRQDGRVTPDPDAFTRIGCQLLATPGELIIMDELGFLERDAAAFRQRVWELIAGPIPVLGVVRQRGSLFLEDLRQRSDTAIWTVSLENRSQMPQKIAHYLQEDDNGSII